MLSVPVKNERESKQLAYVLRPPILTPYHREGGGFGGFNIGFGHGGFGIGFGQEGGFGGNRYPNYRPQGQGHHHHHHHHHDYSDEYY